MYIRPRGVIVTSNYDVDQLWPHDGILCQAICRHFLFSLLSRFISSVSYCVSIVCRLSVLCFRLVLFLTGYYNILTVQKLMTLDDMQRLYPATSFYVSHRSVRDAIAALAAHGWYMEWDAFDSVMSRAAVPTNVVLDYVPCPGNPTEEERRHQIKRGRETARARQRHNQAALYAFLCGVERILDEAAGFEGAAIAKAPRPRFVALCDDHDAPLLPVSNVPSISER